MVSADELADWCADYTGNRDVVIGIDPASGESFTHAELYVVPDQRRNPRYGPQRSSI